ncbi:MAG: hypothetical protein AB7L71_09555 [Vicinamibacterales bacterium]
MAGMIALGGLLFAGFAFLALVLSFMVLVVKAMLFMVLLPFRLIGWAIGAVMAVIGVGIAVALGLVMLLAPLLPLALLAGLVYGIYRLTRRPAVA